MPLHKLSNQYALSLICAAVMAVFLPPSVAFAEGKSVGLLTVEDAIVKSTKARLRGSPNNALKILQAVANIDAAKNSAAFYSERGRVYIDLEKPAQARTDLDRAIALDPGYFDAWDRRGYLDLLAKDWKAAVSDYTRAIAINPHNYKTYNNRACAYRALNDQKSAAKDVEIARTLAKASNSEKDEEIIDQMIAAERTAGPRAAIAYLEKQVDKNGSYAVYINLARMYDKDAQHLKAQENYTRALALAKAPGRPATNIGTALGLRGTSYLAAKKYDLAIKDFSEIIDRAPQKQVISTMTALLKQQGAWAHQMRARAYLAQGEKARAMKDAERLIALEPDAPIVYKLRGEIYAAMGDKVKARADEERARSMKAALTKPQSERDIKWD